jgi:hypothetical protein
MGKGETVRCAVFAERIVAADFLSDQARGWSIIRRASTDDDRGE